MTDHSNIHIDEDFVKNQSQNIDEKDFKRLDKKKKRLRKIMNLGVFVKQKENLKLLFELVQQYRKGTYRAIPWRSLSAIVFTLLYIANPFDIIPDVLPFFGFVDDLSVFLALSNLVHKDLEDYKIWKYGLNE